MHGPQATGDHRVTIRIPEPLYERLQAAAAEARSPLAVTVKRAVERFDGTRLEKIGNRDDIMHPRVRMCVRFPSNLYVNTANIAQRHGCFVGDVVLRALYEELPELRG